MPQVAQGLLLINNRCKVKNTVNLLKKTGKVSAALRLFYRFLGIFWKSMIVCIYDW